MCFDIGEIIGTIMKMERLPLKMKVQSLIQEKQSFHFLNYFDKMQMHNSENLQASKGLPDDGNSPLIQSGAFSSLS